MSALYTTRFVRRRQKLVEAAQELEHQGLNKGAAGNLSARVEPGFMVTPSGVPPRQLASADMVVVGMDGVWDETQGRKPSSEWRFHRDIYAARPDVNAIVHTHAPFCTTLACLGRAIPPFHYMICAAGGRDIRCGGYATFGTQALSDAALAALDGRKACLLANHGMIATGRDLDQAMTLAVIVEELAEQYWRALQVGEPVILPDDEIERVLEKFKTYGANARGNQA